jgi:hypothetical protein
MQPGLTGNFVVFMVLGCVKASGLDIDVAHGVASVWGGMYAAMLRRQS